MSETAVSGRFAHRWGVFVGCDERNGCIRSVRSSVGGFGVVMSETAVSGRFAHRWGVFVGCVIRSGPAALFPNPLRPLARRNRSADVERFELIGVDDAVGCEQVGKDRCRGSCVAECVVGSLENHAVALADVAEPVRELTVRVETS